MSRQYYLRVARLARGDPVRYRPPSRRAVSRWYYSGPLGLTRRNPVEPEGGVPRYIGGPPMLIQGGPSVRNRSSSRRADSTVLCGPLRLTKGGPSQGPAAEPGGVAHGPAGLTRVGTPYCSVKTGAGLGPLTMRAVMSQSPSRGLGRPAWSSTRPPGAGQVGPAEGHWAGRTDMCDQQVQGYLGPAAYGVVRAGRQGGRQLSGSRGGPGLLFVICMSNSDAVGRIRRSSRADVRLTNLCSAGVPRGTESFCLSDI